MARRIYVSAAAADTAFAQRLCDDLRAAGHDVMLSPADLDSMDPQSGDFLSRINTELSGRDAFIIVLSTEAFGSARVKREAYLAGARATSGLMLAPLLVIAGQYPPTELPLEWRSYPMFDATTDYAGALRQLNAAMLQTAPAAKRIATQRPAPRRITPGRIVAVVALLVFVLGIGGCVRYQGPVNTVRDFFSALGSGDYQAAQGLICASETGSVTNEVSAFRSVGGQFSTIDLTFKLLDESLSDARVLVSGSVRVSTVNVVNGITVTFTPNESTAVNQAYTVHSSGVAWCLADEVTVGA